MSKSGDWESILLRYQFHISVTVTWSGFFFFGNFTYVKNLRSLDAMPSLFLCVSQHRRHDAISQKKATSFFQWLSRAIHVVETEMRAQVRPTCQYFNYRSLGLGQNLSSTEGQAELIELYFFWSFHDSVFNLRYFDLSLAWSPISTIIGFHSCPFISNLDDWLLKKASSRSLRIIRKNL